MTYEIHLTNEINHPKDLGKGDVSPCLAAWIRDLKSKTDAGEGIALPKITTLALLHTLVAAKERNGRMMLERDSLKGNDYY